MPMPTKGYEYLEHTADAKFRAYGTTLEEAFQNAAVAMFNVMIDTGIISDEVSEKIELTSADLDGLVVDWLGYRNSSITSRSNRWYSESSK